MKTDKENSLKWYGTWALNLYVLMLLIALMQGVSDAKFRIYGVSPCEDEVKTMDYLFPTYKLGCLLGGE